MRKAPAAAAGVAALAAAAVWWAAAPAAPGPVVRGVPAAAVAPAIAPVIAPTPAPEPLPARVLAAVAPAPAPAGAAPARCAGAVLAVQGPPGAGAACLGPARLQQHGDLRTWQAEAPPWQLEVVLEGEAVHSARLAAFGLPAAVCEGAACAGITLGPRDAHGQRLLRLQQAAFSGEGQALSASGELPLSEPEDACTDGALQVVHERGGAWRFCPSAASAMALLDDGRRLYHLRSQAGDVLQVTLDAEGALAEIALGAWRCRAWACSGATLAPAAEGAWSLALAGVPLLHAGVAARLQGQLQLPAP